MTATCSPAETFKLKPRSAAGADDFAAGCFADKSAREIVAEVLKVSLVEKLRYGKRQSLALYQNSRIRGANGRILNLPLSAAG
jgi:hypothetical protein